MNSILERSRKQQHFESTEKTCNLTITSVVPKLQNAINNLVNSKFYFFDVDVLITFFLYLSWIQTTSLYS